MGFKDRFHTSKRVLKEF